ncbi:hypothetical protein GCM10011608_10260 [Micromonospora sonchi]|uniref:Uncharacterized protein n=1 Tax=Micromonospora sonchi TaxID=1763543 RepID=A0A917TME2_9ACTN|nr:hypothetical protein [Micromonospora sonchi]GGM27443.1 hypothetical protein GCM10011608_10260 [Micromonospora sonchi]
MASKIYEINVFHNGRPVRDINPFLTAIDLDDASETKRDLNRHLLGAVLRSGARRDLAHEFHLEVRDIDTDGKGRGPVLWRWAMPASEGE